MEQVIKWVTTCDQTHSRECHPDVRYDREPPTRLIDLSDPNGTLAWPPCPSHRFQIIKTSERSVDKYVTLSHCWGEKEFARLLMANISTFMSQGIEWSEICRNKNFSHACEVMHRLKVRYIWIDSLCIIQDCKEDWEHEAPLMHKVYRNSYCNIAASDSSNSEGGLFRLRTLDDVVLARYPLDGEILTGVLAGAWRIVPEDLWDRGLLEHPLYGRGWVFQGMYSPSSSSPEIVRTKAQRFTSISQTERMLAPRALHFTSTQIFWDCPTHSACESLPGGLPRELDYSASIDRSWRAQLQQPLAGRAATGTKIEKTTGSLLTSLPDVPYEFWGIAVRNYTSCALSFHSDRLKALSGIAQLVQNTRGGEKYVAGLWETDLVVQLAWMVVDPVGSERPELGGNMRFPTWSWASVTGQVEVIDRVPQNIIYTASGHDGSQHVTATELAEFSGAPPQIAKEEAVIKIQGYRGKGVLVKNDDGPGWFLKIADATQSCVTVPAFPDIFPSQKNGLLGACEFVVLALGKKSLGLQKDGTVNYGPGSRRLVYSGVGLLIEDSEDVEFPGRVRRTGAFNFVEMTMQDWEKVCHACGQVDGVLPKGNGERLFLI